MCRAVKTFIKITYTLSFKDGLNYPVHNTVVICSFCLGSSFLRIKKNSRKSRGRNIGFPVSEVAFRQIFAIQKTVTTICEIFLEFNIWCRKPDISYMDKIGTKNL